MDNLHSKPIVVGVDGSASSKAALNWALDQSGLAGAELHAVIAWEFPAFYSWEGGPMPPEEFEQTACQNLYETVDEALASGPSAVEVVREVRHGHSAQVLLEAAADAGLLVVGSRGHGGFYSALLGSVSQYCATHAHCPIVIVRE